MINTRSVAQQIVVRLSLRSTGVQKLIGQLQDAVVEHGEGKAIADLSAETKLSHYAAEMLLRFLLKMNLEANVSCAACMAKRCDCEAPPPIDDPNADLDQIIAESILADATREAEYARGEGRVAAKHSAVARPAKRRA